MKSTMFLILILAMFQTLAIAQRVENFSLQDAVSGSAFSLAQHQNAKAIVLVFTTNECPFSKLYEERIIDLYNTFSGDGFVFSLVNPHISFEEDESPEAMRNRASEKKYRFSYLVDENQGLTKQLKITKLPEVVVITPSPTGFAIVYRGAIDNNPQMAQSANLKYLESALMSIQNEKNPSPSSTRAVGCNVKLTN